MKTHLIIHKALYSGVGYFRYFALYSDGQSTIEEINSGSDNLQIMHLEKEVEYLINGLKNEKEERQKLQEQIKTLMTLHVAFSAHMNVETYRPTTVQVVPFRTVIVNAGGHYDATAGKFTCPVKGLYYFIFSIHSDNLQAGTTHSHTSAELVMDGKTVVAAHCRNGDSTSENEVQCVQSFVVDCPKDHKVWVQVIWPSENQMYGNHKHPYSSFSGFLLFTN